MPTLQAGRQRLPPITPSAPSRGAVKESGVTDVNSLLSGFWSETKLWNINLVQKGAIGAKRQSLGMPGGAIVMGNGRVPIFSGKYLGPQN